MDIRALRKIRHDGKLYCHGDVIKKMKKEDAERLIAMGAAEELIERQNAKNQNGEQDQSTIQKQEDPAQTPEADKKN